MKEKRGLARAPRWIERSEYDSLIPGTMITACFFFNPRSAASRPTTKLLPLALSQSRPGARYSVTFKGKEGKSATRFWRSQLEERVSKSILRLESESPSVKSQLRKGGKGQLGRSTTLFEMKVGEYAPTENPKQCTNDEEGPPLPEPRLLGLKATRMERVKEGVAQIELMIRRLGRIDPRSSSIGVQSHFWLYVCTFWLATEERDAEDVLERGGGSEGRGRFRRGS